MLFVVRSGNNSQSSTTVRWGPYRGVVRQICSPADVTKALISYGREEISIGPRHYDRALAGRSQRIFSGCSMLRFLVCRRIGKGKFEGHDATKKFLKGWKSKVARSYDYVVWSQAWRKSCPMMRISLVVWSEGDFHCDAMLRGLPSLYDREC